MITSMDNSGAQDKRSTAQPGQAEWHDQLAVVGAITPAAFQREEQNRCQWDQLRLMQGRQDKALQVGAFGHPFKSSHAQAEAQVALLRWPRDRFCAARSCCGAHEGSQSVEAPDPEQVQQAFDELASIRLLHPVLGAA
eukprot:GAFH01004684.1.p2 GENE.GAFH01004684.1~~GAFH01004684.1.p2  ORF type:complete len:138 (+),score=17.58 GAFH01004684.1:336-749(+)